MHIGESAGHAAALSLELGVQPGTLPVEQLQRRLVERGIMLAFVNEFDMATEAPWVPAIQYLGTKGYFTTYNADPDTPLDAETAAEWSRRSGVDVSAGATCGAAARRIYDAGAAGAS
jgi:hypothetical protein